MASSHPVLDQDQELAIGVEEVGRVETSVPIATAPSIISESDGSFVVAEGNRLAN